VRVALHRARLGGIPQTVLLVALIVAAVWSLHSSQTAPASSSEGIDLNLQAALRPAITTQATIVKLQAQIRVAPADPQLYAELGEAYLQRVREIGDPTYYTKAGQVLARALELDPRNVEAEIGSGALALARHDFKAGLAFGLRARSLEPTIPRIYAVIGDAQTELGMYSAAVRTVQHLVDMAPDLDSYSRASYLRELYGRIPDAITAMQLAVETGAPNKEGTEWVRVQLGNLYFNHGDLVTAEQQYNHALADLPNYVPALVGVAQVRVARHRYADAISLYTKSIQLMPLPAYVIALGDVYATIGAQNRAARQYALVKVIDKLLNANGVDTDLETALFYADHRIDLPTSLAKARKAYAARDSIQTADGLAWTLYTLGRYTEAQRYANEALRLGTQDALKIFHAGMIARALGQKSRAITYLRRALKVNPYFSLLYSDMAAQSLKQLETGASGAR
jgi:tetratricopeptide (TPR) repeat protein